MSDTATEIVNLCDDMPRRPTKRSRPERQETKVLNLVDSDDDSPSSVPRPRDQVAQGIERNPIMLTHWGAMEGQGAPRPMPVYRPSSARSRRVALPLPRVNVNTSPIAIDDDDEDENLVQRSTLKHHIPGMPRHQASGADSQANDFTRPPMLPSAPRLVPSTSIAAQQQQQHHHQPQPVQGQDMSAETQHESFGPWRGMLPPVRPARRPFRSMARSDAPGSINQPASHQRLVQGQHAPLPDVDGIEDQEDADMRLAARLQAEEDERLARETIHQMEQEEHRNVMGIRSAAQAAAATAAAIDAPNPTAGAHAQGHAWRFARAAAGRSSALPAETEGGRSSAGTRSSEAAAAALAARWSRLDMLESLENASLAESIRRERERAATRRSERVERFGGGGMVGPGSGDQEYDQDGLTWRAWSRPTRAPGSGSMSIFGGPGGGGDANRAAEAAVLAAAAEEAATAAAAAAAGPAGGSHPRFIARSLQDMIPAMMALPFGFYRIMGGRGDSDDNVGTQRRARHAVATAYREQAVAMREQILAAHRAGIPAHLLLSDRDFTPEDYELLCRLDEGVENRKAAKDEQLAALPTEIVGVEGRRRSDGCQATCIICMEEVVPGDVLKRLPCLHDFHGNCVDTWLKTKACCPICQRGLDTAA